MQGHVDMINLDPKENDTSLTLDLLRAVAAQMVCVGHAIIFFVSGSRPQWLPVMQNIGVLIFFLISGFVIAAALSRRSGDPEYGFLRFFVDRFARIYSGLLPALVLILAVDRLTLALTGESSIAAT
jgi:peptidoglycan/LPS O-acetylase OafA/YrhL